MIELSILQYKTTKKEISRLTEQLKDIRLRIIEYMQEKEISGFHCDDGETNLKQPKSFDVGMFSIENKELYDKFTTMRTIPSREEPFFDKEAFKELHPEEYEKYNLELTPRLTVK